MGFDTVTFILELCIIYPPLSPIPTPIPNSKINVTVRDLGKHVLYSIRYNEYNIV